MEHNAIAVSEKFKKMTVRAILSVVLFVITYLFLVILALILTFLCGSAGVMLIAIKPMFITLMLGAGLLSMGIMVMIFLLKFIFKKHTVDRSNLIEIRKEQEPVLFKFIDEIVKEVKTDFPKKVYLSADVNACVFYDSSFWSMFFPVRKNLQIGVALVNSVSVSEFKAILAHEFGHFSQKSMKVGSYVYNVNQVIYNLLYENDSYHSLASRWASVSSYFTFFVLGAVKIVEGIQRILRAIFEIVNRNYMSLSREMEFHADEVAAHVAGSEALVTSLLRLDLADHSYQTVLSYYGGQISNAVKTRNIYPQQHFVMNFLAKESKLSVVNGLPQVDTESLSKYNKSKLNIENQWASHPSTADRVRALNRLNIDRGNKRPETASILFSNADQLQIDFTEKLFSQVSYENPVTDIEHDKFADIYLKDFESNSFDPVFNSYYDNKNPINFDIGVYEAAGNDFDTLFGNTAVDMVYTSISLESDISILNQIATGDTGVKTFDYDGDKYNYKIAGKLAIVLADELILAKEKIKEHDIAIYRYFLCLAEQKNTAEILKQHYSTFFNFEKEYDDMSEVYNKISNASAFMHQTTPFDVIEKSIGLLYSIEPDFKTHIETVLKGAKYQALLTDEIKTAFEKYVSKEWRYFYVNKYDDDESRILFEAMNHYSLILGNTYFTAKKELLNYQVSLITV